MCRVDGCPNTVAWKGLCNAHYLRLQRYGSPTGEPTPRVSRQRAFFEMEVLRETDDCIIWPYAKSKGYGQLIIDGVKYGVHALALHRRVGAPQPGLIARHGPCHNTACFNYRHLCWGTRIENQRDKLRDGTDARGVKHPAAILDEVAVAIIRSSTLPRSVLAEQYGVTPSAISAVRGRRTWKHLP